MDQSLRRVFSLVLGISFAVAGCSSDDSSKRRESVTEDASVDAGEDTDISPSRDRDAATSGAAGKPSTGTAGTAGTSGTAAAKSCDDLKCAEPAECKEADGKVSCVCPRGYDDEKGDGSACKDKDECASTDDNPCGEHATCKNMPGTYECTCDKGYEGDGRSCKCAEGYVEMEGTCLAKTGGKCEDDLDCEMGNCVSGICCSTPCGAPDGICKTTEGATCEDGTTCKYPVSPDGDACDDGNACLDGSTCQGGSCKTGTTPVDCNDGNSCTDDSCDTTLGCRNANNTNTCDDANACTANDRCLNGACAGMGTVDCTGSADECNTGVCNPADGTCGKKPIADGTLCNDDKTCTLVDQCSAGMCGGQGNSCGPNADSCTEGTPNTCTCKADYVAAAGECVPTNNECAANPCATNAKCFDPSNNANDVTCKCNAGYEGDGRTCTATMPCMDNPCGEGRGTCTAGTMGMYTCACAAGFREIGGTCVCDMGGTFVTKTEYAVSWSNQTGLEDGRTTTYTWTIERHEYDAEGNLEVESVSCGETQPEVCGTGNVLVPREAYAQYIPANVYGLASMPVITWEFNLPKPLPNTAYNTPMTASVTGVSLTDSMGEWPTDRARIAGTPDSGSTITNGARWIDADNDQAVGITTWTVAPGGISANGDGPRPITSYGSSSEFCDGLAYNYPPANEGLTVYRIKRIYSANRIIAAQRGTIVSCDHISGEVYGPNSGDNLKVESVVGGCIRVEGSGETACNSALVNFFSGQSAQEGPPAKIEMRRASDDITCAGARAFQF